MNLKWTAVASPTPDFLGYQVQRRLNSGPWTTIASPATGTTSVVDDSVPADAAGFAPLLAAGEPVR